MYPVLLKSPSAAAAAAASPSLGFPPGLDYTTLLKDSIDRFLTDFRNDSCDFSGFRSIFRRLIQFRTEPPLEILWFYFAVVYHESVSSKNEICDRIVVVRDLMTMLFTFSVPCGGSKSIAVIAPLVSDLCVVAVEVEKLSEKVSEKEMKKLRKEVEELAEGVLSYISTGSSEMRIRGEDSADLLPCFTDLIRVWTARMDGKGHCMRLFFPLATDEIRRGFVGDKCDIDYVAGVVTTEAFLLRLSLKFRSSVASTKGLQNELRAWVVASLTGLGNLPGFEILLRILMQSTLPSIFPLSPQDERFLRTILSDAVLLVEYSFLHSTDLEHFDDSLKSIALTRLMVTYEAIEAARKNGDHAKAISYINAFSKSSLLSRLLEWIGSQSRTNTIFISNATTPHALLKLLVNLEEQGLGLLDEFDNLQSHLKSFNESDLVFGDQLLKEDNKNGDGDLFFFDNKGEGQDDGSDDHEMELVDNAFVSAARSMNSESHGRRKRKGMKGKKDESQLKFVKFKLRDSSAKDYLSAFKEDATFSDSEVDNPSDEDMVEN